MWGEEIASIGRSKPSFKFMEVKLWKLIESWLIKQIKYEIRKANGQL